MVQPAHFTEMLLMQWKNYPHGEIKGSPHGEIKGWDIFVVDTQSTVMKSAQEVWGTICFLSDVYIHALHAEPSSVWFVECPSLSLLFCRGTASNCTENLERSSVHRKTWPTTYIVRRLWWWHTMSWKKHGPSGRWILHLGVFPTHRVPAILITLPCGQSTWHIPEKVAKYRACVNQYMTIVPSCASYSYTGVICMILCVCVCLKRVSATKKLRSSKLN